MFTIRNEQRHLQIGYLKYVLAVSDIENNNLILSAKYSLINSAQQLPLEPSQVHPQTIIHVSS